MKENNENIYEDDDIMIIEIAKRLNAAYGSYVTGISFQHYFRTYVKDEEKIGKYWIELAKKVVIDMTK